MTSPDNILLRLDPADEGRVRAVFDALEARGFPRQQQTPHVTITFAPTMPADVVDLAGELLPAVVPASFRRAGVVVFGTRRRQTVAWLLETSEELEHIACEVSAANPEGRGRRWTPHLTVGLRLPRRMVGEYITALDALTPPDLAEFTAVRAGLWRPRAQEFTLLAGEAP